MGAISKRYFRNWKELCAREGACEINAEPAAQVCRNAIFFSFVGMMDNVWMYTLDKKLETWVKCPLSRILRHHGAQDTGVLRPAGSNMCIRGMTGHFPTVISLEFSHRNLTIPPIRGIGEGIRVELTRPLFFWLL